MARRVFSPLVGTGVNARVHVLGQSRHSLATVVNKGVRVEVSLRLDKCTWALTLAPTRERTALRAC